ncbi:MAG TPA: hypothetical protein VF487_01320 [Chitinophagaceae bacterium]
MKKIFLLVLSVSMLTAIFAAEAPVKPLLKASEIFLPVGNTGKTISLLELSSIKIKDFEELTGTKMKFMDRLTFKAAQRQLRNNIDYDGTFNSKKIERYLKKNAGEGGGFQAGGFFLGFLLGLIGVLIAYLINDDQKRNRVKWAWIGFAAWIGILLIIIAAGGVAYY